MKKLMMAATLAALTFGAAQAATLDWQENGAYNNKDIVAGTGYDHPFAYTVAINVTGTVAADGTDLVKFGYWNGDAFLKVNTNSELRYQAGTWSPSATRPALTTGTHVIAINYTPGNSGGIDVAIYVDGTQYATFNEGGEKTGLNVWLYDNDAWDIINSAAYNGTLTQDEIDSLVANGSAVLKTEEVPEPTALALLALGVAGVALRRRVA